MQLNNKPRNGLFLRPMVRRLLLTLPLPVPVALRPVLLRRDLGHKICRQWSMHTMVLVIRWHLIDQPNDLTNLLPQVCLLVLVMVPKDLLVLALLLARMSCSKGR